MKQIYYVWGLLTKLEIWNIWKYHVFRPFFKSDAVVMVKLNLFESDGMRR